MIWKLEADVDCFLDDFLHQAALNIECSLQVLRFFAKDMNVSRSRVSEVLKIFLNDELARFINLLRLLQVFDDAVQILFHF